MQTYIRFTASVNTQTAHQLQKLLENANHNKSELVHLIISSPGGSINEGIMLYNYIKALPITVNTYNIGQVDSIATALFCAGQRRYSTNFSRFQLHPVTRHQRLPNQWDVNRFGEAVGLLKADQDNIVRIISHTISQKQEFVMQLIEKHTTLLACKALQIGLVHELTSQFIPQGVTVHSITDNRNIIKDSSQQNSTQTDDSAAFGMGSGKLQRLAADAGCRTSGTAGL